MQRKKPAFMPNPASASQNNGASAARSRIGAKSQPPVLTANNAKNANKQTVPA